MNPFHRTRRRWLAAALCCAAGALQAAGPDAAPRYRIIDLGVLAGDEASQGTHVTPGGVVVGRSLGRTGRAFAWSRSTGIVALPLLPGSPAAVANGANDRGVAVGTATSWPFPFNPVPVRWTRDGVEALPLPPGAPYGRAYAINASGVVVGSTSDGFNDVGYVVRNGVGARITATAPNGSYLSEAFALNDRGLAVGYGIDPSQPARNVALVVDLNTNRARDLGGTPGRNGGIAFGVGPRGHVVGTSMQDQGEGIPFVYVPGRGMQAIPLVAGTSGGSGRAVNSAGWVVGYDYGLYSVPFLSDGERSWRLADLIPADSGWDLLTNTSSAATAINDRFEITGTGVRDGQPHAFLMVPVR